jgi:cytochrome c oxidase subunit 2
MVLAGAIVLGGCQAPSFGAYRGATTQAQDTFKLWVGMVIAGLIVAAIVWALIFWAVIRYRRRDDHVPRQTREHIPLEITYTVVPLLIVIAIFYFTVVTENKVDKVADNPAATVDVTAFQWGWRFQYRGTPVVIETTQDPPLLLAGNPTNTNLYPQLVLPEHETTRIVLRSADVAHSMLVPAFLFSRMALPGVTNLFDFTPTETGVFQGRCNQYCGLYHSEMLFSVKVVAANQFRSWLSTEEATLQGSHST